jgi:cytochrome c oxidase subunit 1
MPRRIFRAEANYGAESWELAGALTGIGGTLMTVGAVMFFLVIVMTIFFGKKGEGPKDIPFAETLIPASREGWDVKLDRIGLWTVAAVVLVLIAYAPFFLTYLPARLVSPGYTFF